MSEMRVIHVREMANYPGVIYVGRSMPRLKLHGHPLANPFRIGKDGDRAEVIRKYREWLDKIISIRWLPTCTLDLRHAPALACWCRYDGESRTDANACHADVLVELIGTYTDDELRALISR